MNNIQIIWKRNKRARRLSIRIKPGAVVCVTRPYSVSLAEAQQFVLQNKTWIEEKCIQAEKQSGLSQFRLQDQAHIPYLGRMIQIQIIELNAKKSSSVFENDILKLTLTASDQDLSQKSKGSLVEIKKLVESWYKQQALVRATDVAQEYASRLGIIPKSISVRSFRSRWGACSSKKEVFLNWQIATLKPDLFDYVVAHELCHLIHMNHSPKFYSLLDQLGFNKSHIRAEFKNLQPIEFV